MKRSPLLRSASAVFVATAVVSVINYLRDSSLVATLGAGSASDAFFSALLVPTILAQTLLPGILISSLLPVYEEVRRDRDQGARLLGAVAVIVGCGSLLLTLPALAWARQFVGWLVPGFDAATIALTAAALRWMLVALPLLALGVLARAALHADHRFTAAALAPGVTGVAVLATLLVGGFTVRTLAVAATAGMVAQFLTLAVAFRRARIPARLPQRGDLREVVGLDRVGRMALPLSVAAVAGFAPTVVERWWASHLAVGTVAHLTLVHRLMGLPLVLVGSSVSTALLPRLSAAAAAGDRRRFTEALDEAVALALPLLLLCAAWLTGAADTVVALLYRHGAFGVEDAAATAAILRSYAWGLPATSLWIVLLKGLVARQDAWTHVALVVLLVPVDLALLALLVPRFGALGLGPGFAAATWLGILMQALVLSRRHRTMALRHLLGRLAAWLPATVAALGATWLFEVSPGGDGLTVAALFVRLVFAGLAGLAAFLLVSRLTGRWNHPRDLFGGWLPASGRDGGGPPTADTGEAGDDQGESEQIAPPR